MNQESAATNQDAVVLRTDKNGLATLTLNRPDKLNALSTEMFAALETHIRELADQSGEIGCVLIRGNGKAFCAGADLNIAEGEPDDPARWRSAIIRALSELPQPVIAAIHGYCITGGLELALGADIILAAESARFADTHGKWGFVGAWGMTQRLPHAVGLAYAKEMTWTSRFCTGQEAVAMGLATRCFTDAEFDGALAEYTASILKNSWHSNFGSKKLLNATRGHHLIQGLDYELANHPGRSADSEERVVRFLRK